MRYAKKYSVRANRICESPAVNAERLKNAAQLRIKEKISDFETYVITFIAWFLLCLILKDKLSSYFSRQFIPLAN